MEHKKPDIHDISDELLLKYFRCDTNQEEEKEIEEWYNAGNEEKERQKFKNIHDFYEAYLLNAPIGMIQGNPSVPETTVHKKKIYRRILLAATNIAAAIAIFLAATYISRESIRKEMAETFTSIEVPPGQRIDICLCDGTSVKLNSGAKIQYPNIFSKDSREVHLDGEAYFDVAHDSEKPFIVRTFASDIEVLGTEFNVNAIENAGKFSATLIEGSIRLTNRLRPEKEIIMRPDQTVRLAGNDFSIETGNANSAVRWTKGILNVDTQDFAELMKKLEMAFGVKIVISRDTMPELKYLNGKLRISDGIISALNVLQGVADFQYVKDYNTDTIYIK